MRQLRGVGVGLVVIAALSGNGADAQTRVRFTPPVAWSSSFAPGEPLVGDVNGDGKDDLLAWSRRLVAGVYVDDVRVFVSEGHRFATPQLWSQTSSGYSHAWAVTGDFNGDQRDDLALIGSNPFTPSVGGAVMVHVSNGQWLVAGVFWDSVMSRGPLNGTGQPVFRAADVNADGRDDLVLFVRESRTGVERGDVWVALSAGNGFEAPALWHDFFSIGAEIPMLGDVDGDGDADAVTFVRSSGGPADHGKVRVARSNRVGFDPWQEWHPFFCVGSELPGLGDFDGDGATDAATFVGDGQGGADNGAVRVVRSTRTSFTNWTNWLLAFATAGAVPQVGDFNGDRQDDVLSWRTTSSPSTPWSAAVAAADTSMSLSSRPAPSPAVQAMLSSTHVGGFDGLYLKRVGGPVLAARGERTPFDPASALKATVHAHAMLEVLNVNPATGQPYRRLSDRVWTPPEVLEGSCPDLEAPFVSRTLESALTRMMRISTNDDPEGLRLLFGRDQVDRTIAALGMDSTRYRHVIGCGKNETTLEDLGRLYEAVGRGLLENRRFDFERMMATGIPGALIQPMVVQYAAMHGLPADFAERFGWRVDSVGKIGFGSNGVVRDRALAGNVVLPLCSGSTIVNREYVFGIFYNEVSSGSFVSLEEVVAEALRQEIRTAVFSFSVGGCTI